MIFILGNIYVFEWEIYEMIFNILSVVLIRYIEFIICFLNLISLFVNSNILRF